ncbi:MAG: peptide chain release factor N(5)-glutamine methyltransferase [Chitinophagaceae bacterium]|nr:peptide chain release factor N(5)-glutamine methyltransferase [Chitinophagaceae bacterium]
MTMQEATYYLLNQLQPIYGKSEASAITDLVMEKLTGSGKAERMIYKNEAITAKEEEKLKVYTEKLLQHEPVQYVLHEAWFAGLKFYVDPSVLIPRPETEELVEWIIEDVKFPVDELSILDIGSGSGCIPITLKRRMKRTDVWSCDISEPALEVAKKNAATLNAAIQFRLLNILQSAEWESLPQFDVIASNPPYVPAADKSNMSRNVLAYEPHTALFVPDEDPLLFYKAIAELGKQKLKKDGKIYCEIYEDLGDETTTLFQKEGYKTELRKDMQQKNRLIKACL